jgi:hypothetical protein
MTDRQFSCCRKLFLAAMRDLPNSIQLDFQGQFWNDGLLLRTESSSLWKQATTNEIKMTNAVIAADRLVIANAPAPAPATSCQH